MKLYQDKKGFSMAYPDDWSVNEIEHGLLFTPDVKEDNEEGKFRKNLVFIIQKLPEGMTLKQYSTQNVAQIKREIAVKSASAIEDATIYGMSARSITLTVDNEGSLMTIKQSWFMVASIAFSFTFTANADAYEATLPNAQAIVDSFSLKVWEDRNTPIPQQ